MDKFKYLSDRNDLADLLKIPRNKLTYILYVRGVDNFYTSFEIPKKSGGTRQISAPNNSLKYIQRSLADEIWQHEVNVWGDKITTRNISHAFEANKSIVTNARIHRNKRYIVNFDLENFFDSFHFGRVLGYFEKNRDFLLPHKLAAVMAQLVCFNGRLPQGAPSSPVITNLICQVFDLKVLRLAKKYKLDYTRYADDLTFSTNNKTFVNQYEMFVADIGKLISYSGFSINEQKTRCVFKTSRQEVTGLTVNKIINVPKEFYKETRAMAHHLYKYGEFNVKGQSGSINQLEGRFAFINHIEQSNLLERKPKKQFRNFSSKEKEYQKFIFFKYFMNSDKPVLITEGETDIAYIKAALKKHYLAFPALVTKNDVDKFEFNLSFLRRTPRNEYFLNLVKDGADTIKNLYDLFTGKNGNPNLAKFFYDLSESKPRHPVILMFDNELVNNKMICPRFMVQKQC